MKVWTTRPTEEAFLLNPSFCAFVVWSAATGYRSASKAGMAFEFAFVTTPIVLHRQTREALPKSTYTSMPAWIEENSFFRVGYAERAQNLVPFIREAILFGLHHKLFWIDDEGRIVPSPPPRKLSSYLREATEEVRQCANKAQFVGKWFAGVGSVESAMALWGVRP